MLVLSGSRGLITLFEFVVLWLGCIRLLTLLASRDNLGLLVNFGNRSGIRRDPLHEAGAVTTMDQACDRLVLGVPFLNVFELLFVEEAKRPQICVCHDLGVVVLASVFLELGKSS